MKKTVLILAAVVVAVLVWYFWALGRNTGALEEAARHLEDGDAPAAIKALDRMTSLPLEGRLGHLERAARLRLFANRLGRLRDLSPGELLDFEVKIVARRDRFPRTLFAVSSEVARRLARVVPDPIHVNAERLVVLWDGHPVTRLTVGGEMLARRGPNRFGAGNLGDDPDPREVLLEDPEGFRGTTRAVVRVDVKAPAITTVRAPAEVASATQFRVECDADEPVVRVVHVTVRGARLLGAGGGGTTGWIRAIAGRVPGADDVGLMTWSFEVEDAVGNRSAAVSGQATGVPAAWLERARTLGTATRAEMLEMERWTRRHWKFLPETRRTVATEAERRLRALIPATLSLDSPRTIRLPNDHPVTTLEIDGRACARREDGSFDAAGIPDATAPREVVLGDPHGFRATTRVTIRIRP